MSADHWITLGRILGPYGVRGWVKLFSDTHPAEAILKYENWWLGEKRSPWRLIQGRRSGQSLLAQLAPEAGEALLDRDQALALRGMDITVPRSALPALPVDANYLSDMIGLSVTNLQGESLGRVVTFLESAAHPVLLSQDEAGSSKWLIPFVRGPIVQDVDLENGLIRADWSADWQHD